MVAFAATTIWIAIQARAFRRLHRWGAHPLGRLHARRMVWSGHRPYRALLRQRGRTRTVLAQLREVWAHRVIPDAVISLNANGEIGASITRLVS